MSAVGNLISWFIAYVIMALWYYVGFILGIFGQWQVGLDGIISTMESFAFDDMGTTYSKNMNYVE